MVAPQLATLASSGGERRVWLALHTSFSEGVAPPPGRAKVASSAPFDAHDPILIQEILLGLTRTPAEKADLAMAENTKICEFACYEIFNLPMYDLSMGASST